MKTTLVIMAAGIGSRFGSGIKQLEPLGPSGELMIDYSIYDALQAGFEKVVFVIRPELEPYFKEMIGDRLAKKTEVAYVYQELTNLPEGFTPGERTKPWGTGQAILACKNTVKEPFAVINADDYYGASAFQSVHDFLVNPVADENNKHHWCMAGYLLENTLSDNGGVTRGICNTENGLLTGITETRNVEQVDGKAVVHGETGDTFFPKDTVCSMNMWGLTPAVMTELEEGFKDFLNALPEGDVKSEYLLPTVIGDLVSDGVANVRVLPSHDKWFGVTFAEDKPVVKESLRKLKEAGVYPEKLNR